MQAFRIEPIQQRPFIVVAEENQDLSRIVHQPLCLPPVNFTIEEVSAKEIDDNDKIILLSEDLSVKQITKSRALDILVPGSQSDSDYLEGCVSGLIEAMEEIGMAPPAFIQLNNQLEALRLLNSLSDSLKIVDYNNLKDMIENGRIYSMRMGGIEFRWGPPQAQQGRVLPMERHQAA
jgi:hypothetical protein